jgi:hypothetical protein
MRVDLDLLRKSDNNLFRAVATAAGKFTGNVDVDPATLPTAFQKALAEYQASPTDATPDAPQGYEHPGNELPFSMDDVKEAQRLRDEDAAFKRVEHYIEQGLDQTPENANALKTYVEKWYQGRWTPTIVDNSIAYLSKHGQLSFTKPGTPKPAEAAPPPQLTIAEFERMSLAEQKAWLKAERAKQPVNRGGYHGLKF